MKKNLSQNWLYFKKIIPFTMKFSQFTMQNVKLVMLSAKDKNKET